MEVYTHSTVEIEWKQNASSNKPTKKTVDEVAVVHWQGVYDRRDLKFNHSMNFQISNN